VRPSRTLFCGPGSLHRIFLELLLGPALRDDSAPRSTKAMPSTKQKGSTPAALCSKATFDLVKYDLMGLLGLQTLVAGLSLGVGMSTFRRSGMVFTFSGHNR
jgi:hypothetical protein